MKELADAKAENDALQVMMLPLVVVGCTSKQSVSQCVKPPRRSGVDNAASPDWQTPLNGLFHPQREADHYAKTTGRNPGRHINEQEIELPISMGNSCNYCEQYTRASSGV